MKEPTEAATNYCHPEGSQSYLAPRLSLPESASDRTAPSNMRLIRILQAPPDKLDLIDGILDGKTDKQAPSNGPLLLGMGAAAKLLGTSRATLWRMIRAGRLKKIEMLPGSFRIRRTDLEALVR